jgi:putative ABC transport system permease protein
LLQLICGQFRLDSVRTLMRGCALASVVAVILLLEGVYAGQLVQLEATVMNRAADLIVAQSGVSNMIAVRSILPQYAREEVESIRGVAEAHPLAGIALIYEKAERRTPISLFVYDSAGGPSKIVAGLPIRNDREIIIDRSLARKYDLSPGDSFVLSDFEFRIAGISAGAAAYFTPFGFVLFDDLIDFYFESDLAEDISSFPLLSFLLVDLNEGENPEIVAALIEEAVPSADVFQPAALAANDMDLGRVTLGPIFGTMIIVAYVIGALVTAVIMFAAINGRRHGLGIMKALGFSNGFLLRLVLLEALILAMFAFPVGLLLAKLVANGVEIIAPLYLILTAEQTPLIRTSLACGLFALIGSVLPFRLIYRLDPSQVFRS